MILVSVRRLVLAVLVAVLVGVIGVGGAVGSWTTASALSPGGDRTEPKVLHRVVWDHLKHGRKGIHLRSARLDGGGLRRIYDVGHGFITELTLDRAGRRVAFAPCCGARRAAIVVVPVLGGEPLEPLARHPRIFAAGGIGWSPDGKRIAFEGYVAHGGDSMTSLYTIRPDGTGLRLVLRNSVSDHYTINNALAWTRDGILYSDGHDLRSAWAGSSHVVLRRVGSVRISGDGRRLVTERWSQHGPTVWMSRTDGSDARRILRVQAPAPNATIYSDVTPGYDASALLAARFRIADESGGPGRDDVVTWATDEPAESNTVVDVARGAFAVTWN
ncbi:PD40 domain-containing protein [Nocardioides sp. KIGAM211]|uniref:PD40 domain-containing protein n=1 Tax=Nocardioides luti TaxID=2761101 RepID=A0A7X0VBR1_9ACTN|nr:PD40 domain-containing protein [Nocardioides luti]MBB6628227.1 PD40 domain-containing protein [Nocardioides luti]